MDSLLLMSELTKSMSAYNSQVLEEEETCLHDRSPENLKPLMFCQTHISKVPFKVQRTKPWALNQLFSFFSLHIAVQLYFTTIETQKTKERKWGKKGRREKIQSASKRQWLILYCYKRLSQGCDYVINVIKWYQRITVCTIQWQDQL